MSAKHENESQGQSEDGRAQPIPMTVPDAGQHYYGMSKWASYRAAKRGDIPTIKIGGRLRAVVQALERKLAEVE